MPSFKPLTPPQQTTATSVYSASIEFSNVFISDLTGLGGLPFTAAIALFPLATRFVMNLVTFSPSRDLLIHELAHVWQGQHDTDPTRFMKNSVAGQAAAVAANGAVALIDPTVKTHPDFPTHFPFSTYAYLPGNPFSSYGAEQIANQAEHGEASIVAHMASASVSSPDADNIAGLKTSRIQDRRAPGVIF